MAKKTDRSEPKKECPSCGLGVSLESNICEFCGWDFLEEDEWILQIEKLERDLLLEKQKFQPGTVNHRIESTLKSPLLEKTEASQAPAPAAEPQEHEEPKVMRAAEFMIDRETSTPTPQAETAVAEVEVAREPQPEAVQEPPAEVVEESPAPKVRKVRNVRSVQRPPEPEPVQAPQAREKAPGPLPLRKVRRTVSQEPSEPVQAEGPSKKVRTVRKVKG